MIFEKLDLYFVFSGVKLLPLLFSFMFSQSGFFTKAEAQQNNAQKIRYTHSHLNPGDALMLVGYFDDIHYMQLYLARDGDLWEGYAIFPDDSLEFPLEGGWSGDADMLLLEFNREGEKSGLWQVVKESDHYRALWSNKNNSMQKEAILFDDLWNPDVKKDFYKLKSDFYFKVDKTDLMITVHQNRSGIEWVDCRNPKSKSLFKSELECTGKTCSDFTLKISANQKNTPIVLDGIFNKNALSGIFTTPNNKVFSATPLLTETRETKLKTVLNDHYSLAVEYPVLTGIKMAGYIKEITDAVLKELEEEIHQQILQDSMNSLADRQKLFGFAWFEIFYWDNQFVSGKWTVQKSWNALTESLVFNYDLTTELPINFSEQFKPDFDFKFFIEKYLQAEKQKMMETKDLLQRNKVSQCAFTNINFSEDGLLYASDFDTVYGAMHIVVPASELVLQLKNKSQLKKIFEK